MSGPLGVAIEVDTSQALPELERVKGGLRATQSEMEKLKASVAQGFQPAAAAFKSVASAIDQERAALGRLAVIQDQQAAKNATLARGFAGVAQAIEREQAVLQSIRGPAQQFARDQQLINSMLERGVIDANEHAAAMAKAKTTAGGGSAGGLTSMLPQLMTGGVVGAAVMGVGHEVESIIDEHRQLEDEYTKLSNQALKFATSGKTVTQVMVEQSATADAMHATLEQEMNTYEGVRNALMDVTLTSTEMASATKTIGDATQLAGKPMDSAGEILNRVVLALNSGADAGKALKSVMIQYPALGQLLAEAYKTDEAGLVKLAQQHKLTAQGVADAIATETNSVTSNFGKRKVTHEQEIAIYKEQANTLRQQGVPALMAYTAAGNEAFAQATRSMQDPNAAVDEATAKILELAEETSKLRGAFKDVGVAENKAIGGMLDDITSAVGAFGRLHEAIGVALGKDAWAGADDKTGLLALLPKGIKTAMELAAALGQNKKQIDDLNAAYTAGGMSTTVYLAKLEQLTAGIRTDKAAAADLANDGTATLKKYTDAVYEAKRALVDLNAARSHMDETTYRSKRDSLETTIYGRLPETIKQLEEIRDPLDNYTRQTAALDELLATKQISWGEWEMQLEKVAHTFGVLTENEKTWAQLQRDLDPGKAGADAVAASEKAAGDLKELAAQTREEAKRGQHAHSEALTKDWHTAIEQIDKQIEAMKENARTVLDPLKDSFVEIVTTGTTDVAAMFKKIETGVVGKIAEKAEGGLLDAVFGKTSAQMQGAAVQTAMGLGGTTAGATIAERMIAAGATVAATIGGAMSAGGVGGATAAGLGGLVFGTAASAGTESIGALGTSDLPVGDVSSIARTGGPGAGGSVHITPGQVATAAAQSTSGAPRIVQHYNMMYDRNAIISNRSDDERFLSAVRRNPSAYRASQRR